MANVYRISFSLIRKKKNDNHVFNFRTQTLPFHSQWSIDFLLKIVTILTYWALVCIAKVNRAVGRIWRAANVKVISTSKYWTVATVAKDGFSFLTIYQRHLCWWQATGIDKAEQERTWCSFVQSSIWQKNIYWVRLVVLQFSIANRDKTRTKSGLTTWVKKKW